MRFENRFGYNEALPPEIREIFMWLSQDVASLQGKWTFYLGLFGEEAHTILLSSLARAAFNIIEESLRNDMTLAICRLSDPSQTFRKDNLSMATLVELSAEIPYLEEILVEFQDACKPVQKYRNKRVGHNDLNTTIKPQENPLPGISHSQINSILELGGRLLNTVLRQYVDEALYFEPVQRGGAKHLLYWLGIAKKHRDDDRDRHLGSGTA